MLRITVYFSKKKKIFSRNIVPALKLRTKIVDNKENLFLNYPDFVLQTQIDFRVMGLSAL